MSEKNPYRKTEDREKTTSDTKNPSDNPLLDGWNNFVSSLDVNFKNFKNTLEEQTKKNVEAWEDTKQNVEQFFSDAKKNWDNQLNEWNQELKRKHIENVEQWEAKKRQIREDFEDWQKKTKKDLENGLKSWNRFWLKSSYMFLLFMIPFLIIVVIIAIAISMIRG